MHSAFAHSARRPSRVVLSMHGRSASRAAPGLPADRATSAAPFRYDASAGLTDEESVLLAHDIRAK